MALTAAELSLLQSLVNAVKVLLSRALGAEGGLTTTMSTELDDEMTTVNAEQ
jgi:hypothetical protein